MLAGGLAGLAVVLAPMMSKQVALVRTDALFALAVALGALAAHRAWERGGGWLPFWLANLIERMWLVLGILLAALLPLSRVVPPLYQFRVRSRVFRWYGRLREIENDMECGQLPHAALAQALDQLEIQVEKVIVPLSYADELYALRNHIHLVRQKLPQV